jgi:hypothetical protein
MELFHNKKGKLDIKLDTIEDRIAAYMIDKLPAEAMLPEEFEIMRRWNAIWALLNNFHSPTQAVKAHVKQCKEAGLDISERTAWYDYRNATKLWGNVITTTYQSKIVLLEEFAMQGINMALEAKDRKEYNKAVKNLFEITKENKMLESLMGGDPGAQNKYVLEIHVNGHSEPWTIDLDQSQVLPDEEQSKIMEAVESSELSTATLRKMLESGK